MIKKPPLNHPVIIYTPTHKSKKVGEGFWNGKYWFYVDESESVAVEVTSWLYFPKPREKRKV